MIWFHFVILLVFMVIGARLGGIGIGLAGGAGVLVLALTGLKVDTAEGIPWIVIGIIMPVICAISALQVAGGLDFLVHITEKFLRRHPRYITYLAPLATYLLALLSGTGHTAYSLLPVIVDVAKESKVRPSRPLSIAVVASQIAVVASPIAASTIAVTAILESQGVGYLQILAVVIPTTFIGCFVGAVVASRQGVELEDDPVYQDRLQRGLVSKPEISETNFYKVKNGALIGLACFLIALVLSMLYSILTSERVGIIKNPPIPNNGAIMVIMMTATIFIVLFSGTSMSRITEQSIFRAGMSAAVCIIGVAWLGNTFVNSYMSDIKASGSSILSHAPWLLAVVLYLAAPLLFSHAATTTAFIPAAVAIGMSNPTILACYPAVSNYYLLPNYPTTVAAIEMDDTGTTRVGKLVINHPFFVSGTVSIIATVALGFLLAPIVLS